MTFWGGGREWKMGNGEQGKQDRAHDDRLFSNPNPEFPLS